MRETRKKWFVIETDTDGSWMNFTACETWTKAIGFPSSTGTWNMTLRPWKESMQEHTPQF